MRITISKEAAAAVVARH